MGALIPLVFLLQDASLVDRLGDDDPAVRDAASAELAREGERAVPKLIPVLSHSSAEVRGRAADLLFRLPEFRWTRFLAQPESPLVARSWNAMVDACVGKRPIPGSLWRDLGHEEAREELREVREWSVDEDREPSWIVGRMAVESVDAIRDLARKVGVDCEQRVEQGRGRGLSRLGWAFPVDLLTRLAELGAGERSQEEIYGTLLMLGRHGLMPVFSELSGRDRDLVLRVLIHWRDRPGDRDPRPPRSREEALDRVARGPWMAGLARGLAEDFGGQVLLSRQQELVSKSEPPTVSSGFRWEALTRIYGELADLEEDLSLRFELVAGGARPGLPERRPPLPLIAQRRDDDRAARRKPRLDLWDSPLLEAVCLQSPLEPDALGVVEAVVGAVHPSRHPEIQAGLLRALARGVVREARAALPPGE